MRKAITKTVAVMLATILFFAAAPLSGILEIGLPIYQAKAVEITDTEISGKLGTKLNWSIDIASKTLMIDNSGIMPSFSSTKAPWKDYKSYFDTVVISDGCDNIGQNAFEGCDNIVSVDLPITLYSIDSYAFLYCGNLSKIEIPYGVTEIGNSSFADCENLKSVEMPNSIKSICGYAFAHCTSLESITLPDSVTLLGYNAFYDCTALSNISLGSGISAVGSNAFSNCTSLAEVILPYNCVELCYCAFANCTNLARIYIYNRNCSIDQTAIPLTATIYSFANSPVENFTTQYGYNFVSIDTPCDHEYSNNCDDSCNKCGEIREASHQFGEWVIEREATCTLTGLKVRTCSVCNAPEREPLPLLDHTDADDNGICDICKKQFALRYPQKGVCGPNLTWALDDDGVLTIEGYGEMYDFYNGDSILISDGTQQTVETTTHYNDRTTKSADDDVEGPTDITKVTTRRDTGLSVTHPGNDDYYREESTCVPYRNEGLTNPYVESTTAPAAIRRAAKQEYYPDVTKIAEETTKPQIAPDGYILIFRWNLHFDEVKKVVISEGVTSIGANAFKNCKQLSEIDIADSVESIGYCAFAGCVSLKEISIPKNVKTIGRSAFGNCELLDTFDFNATDIMKSYNEDGSEWFSSVNGSMKFDESDDPDIHLDIPTSVKTLSIGADVKWVPKIISIKTIVFKEGVTQVPDRACKELDKLSSVCLPMTLTRIGNFAFYGCNSIESITIPAQVEYIGTDAFDNCLSLETLNFNALNCCNIWNDCFNSTPVKTINIGIGVNVLPKISTIEKVSFAEGSVKVPDNAFSHCAKLTDVYLPGSIEAIGNHAFEYCEKLRSVRIPQNLKTVGIAAFLACYNLRDAELPSTLTRIESGSFDNCTSLPNIAIPDSVEYIGRYAFYGCVTASEVTIPNKVKYIGFAAFGSCNGLESVIFNATDCSVNIDDIFYNSSNISTVKIGTGVTTIPNAFIKDSKRITAITIPNTVRIIGSEAFSGTALTEITLPESVEEIGHMAFAKIADLREINFNAANVERTEDPFINSGLKGMVVNFGDSVVRIPNDMFWPNNYWIGPAFNSSVVKVNFGKNIKEIGSNAFASCERIEELRLPESLEVIGNGAFRDCTGLTELTIPEGICNIASGAFTNCSSVEVINYNAKSCETSVSPFNCQGVKIVNIGDKVESIPAYAFGNCPNLERVVFPDTAIQIDPLAFEGCGNVAIVCRNGSYANVYAIQNGIKYILEDDVGGTAFVVQNGMLLGYSGAAQNIVLPSDINSIGIGAFNDNRTVKAIEIPYNISKIYSNAFANCPNLERVIIPFTVTDISPSAFSGTNAIIYCYYNSYAYKYAVANSIKCELITVTLSNSSVSTFAGGSVTVKALPSVTVASGIPLVWRSDDPSVAYVDSYGNIIGKKEGTATIGVYSHIGDLLAECSVVVKGKIGIRLVKPSIAAVKYGETLILHLDISTLPDGMSIEWSTTNKNAFSLSDISGECTIHKNCMTCGVKSVSKGSATITAKVVDKNGNPVKDANGNEITASQSLTSKAGFFQKLAAFFKKLFGSNMVIPYVMKNLMK